MWIQRRGKTELLFQPLTEKEENRASAHCSTKSKQMAIQLKAKPFPYTNYLLATRLMELCKIGTNFSNQFSKCFPKIIIGNQRPSESNWHRTQN